MFQQRWLFGMGVPGWLRFPYKVSISLQVPTAWEVSRVRLCAQFLFGSKHCQLS